MSLEDTEAVYVFDTTTAAMWAEEVAMQRGIPAEVIPAPADSDAKCDLALRTRRKYARSLSRAMDEEGVTYRAYA